MHGSEMPSLQHEDLFGLVIYAHKQCTPSLDFSRLYRADRIVVGPCLFERCDRKVVERAPKEGMSACRWKACGISDMLTLPKLMVLVSLFCVFFSS